MQPEVVDRYLTDVAASVDRVAKNPDAFADGMAPVYGMACAMPDRGVVSELLVEYMSTLYAPAAAAK